MHTNPIDGKGMNAGYPGRRDGTQTDRALALVAAQIVEPADVIVDLHGGDSTRICGPTATDAHRQRRAGRRGARARAWRSDSTT